MNEEEMDGGEMGGMSGDGSGGTRGRHGIGMESSDDDSPTAALESMGYLDNGAKMGGHDDPNSGFSALQVVFLVLVGILGVYVLYSVITGILGMFGVGL